MNRSFACALLLLAPLGSARAEKFDLLKRYEEALVQSALQQTKLVVDPAPDGKIIEGVVIVANKVILPGDFPLAKKIPWTWLNHLHTRTRDYIIAQELLFHVGEPLRMDVVEETGRNLRALFILAVARLVVTRGSTPDRVVILVVTKDQWTLRLNTDFTTDQARLDTLSFSISESNLAGRNKAVSIQYALDPGRHTVGVGYVDPRIGGSRHQISLTGDLFLNRDNGNLEGQYGQLLVGRPLYSLRTQWGWQASATYDSEVVRQFQGGTLRQLTYGTAPNVEYIPDFFRAKSWNATLQGVRSFGVLDKVNLTAGFVVASGAYSLTQDFPTTLSAGARAAYVAILPRSESASGPFLQLDAYRASYVRLQNINSFALSEDFRVGPIASMSVRFVDPAFGFDTRFLAIAASYGAAYFGRDNLVAFTFSGSARLQPSVLANQSWVDQIYDASFSEITPRFGWFRLVLAGALEMRRNDLTNARISLGSDSGLRGFEPRYFVGNNFYRVNVELRSRPINLWTLHFGFVLFYDGGDAPASLLTASWHQDAGIGLRLGIPEFNKDLLRFDLGFPMEMPVGTGYAPRFSVSFGQAF